MCFDGWFSICQRQGGDTTGCHNANHPITQSPAAIVPLTVTRVRWRTLRAAGQMLSASRGHYCFYYSTCHPAAPATPVNHRAAVCLQGGPGGPGMWLLRGFPLYQGILRPEYQASHFYPQFLQQQQNNEKAGPGPSWAGVCLPTGSIWSLMIPQPNG